MTLRTKLAGAMTGLVVTATVSLGYGVVSVSKRYYERDARQTAALIESYVQKAARDALIQKDDLSLLSYLNFLRSQYPALARAHVNWAAAGRGRELSVGAASPGQAMETREISLVDPADKNHRISVRIDLDRRALFEAATQGEDRLIRTILLVALITLTASFLMAIWISNSITAPVKRLGALAADIAAGKLGVRMDWESGDEIGRLVRSFNQMSHRLEELDEIKKNFVSSVTHELRSPLGAMESFLTLMAGKVAACGASEAVQMRDYISRVQTNVQRLSRFINDLLDVAKIEKGKMECSLRPMRLQDVAGEVCQFFGPKAQQQGVTLTQNLDGLPDVMGDCDRLRQVLINLVANALKFTPSGGSILINGEQFRENSQRWVEVVVQDTGQGMPPSDVQRLFQAFSQGRNVSKRVVGTKGTGLGLYITKSIVEQHGGKIGVKSEPGKGTAVSFSLAAA